MSTSVRLRGFVDLLQRFWTQRRSHALIIAVLAIGLLALVIAVLVVRSGPSSGVSTPRVTVPAASPATTVAPVVPTVVVQAAGAVRSPGVYRLPVGARVVDLLERAGGPTGEFDLERTNLASLLVDGERVWVPRVGESAPPVAGGSGGSSGSPSLIDLNHAQAEQLDALPGIGKTLAAAIVADRQRRGSFRSADDLLRVKGMNKSKIDALRDLVVIG